jgi:AraC-like DNA-binding protein
VYSIVKIENNPNITGVYTAFSHQFGADFRFKGEAHDFWELVCVTMGLIQVASDNQIFSLSQGQAILHAPMQFHNITARGNSDSAIAVFTFSGNNIPPLQDRVFEIDDLSKVRTLLELAQKHYRFSNSYRILEPHPDSNGHLLYVKQLELFLLELTGARAKRTTTPSRTAENYSLIVKTIHTHADQPLSIAKLAAMCHMSPINLQKTFSHFAGVGIMEYANRIKMQKAVEYLRQGLSVKETALRVGFSDQNYFSTAFKRIIGHAPSRIIK